MFEVDDTSCSEAALKISVSEEKIRAVDEADHQKPWSGNERGTHPLSLSGGSYRFS